MNQKFGITKIFFFKEVSLFVKKYSNNCNIVNYYYK